ncbi:major tail protein [Pseudomonas phage PMBT14]|uniref:Major tail protein n=1 Tax=Pseudomonas phage PMBT14 TaxID=2059855 RepID=A0A2I6PI45_9CAUD|nr:major tail protein [Pseudomonas phage PMBT14]AUM59730.1 major tail protein [Pseudomonas phage PMBT14]
MADGSRHSLRIVPEVTPGITPTNPAWQTVRHTGTTLAISKESLQSEELRDDRQIADFRLGARQVGGDISIELSYGSFDMILEALLQGTWTGNVLKAGVVRRTFSLERFFADLGTANKPYHRFRGVEFNTLALTIAANAMVTGTIGVLGLDSSLDTVPLAGATVAPATTTSPLDSFTGTLSESGTPIAVVTELTLNLDNGMAARFVVGSKVSIKPSVSRSNLTGQVTAYFEDSRLLDKFITEENSSLVFTMPDGEGNAYEITIPRLKYTGGQPDVAGEGPITLSMPFQALLDPSQGTQILVERIPHVTAP